jgi:hypothetical protein
MMEHPTTTTPRRRAGRTRARRLLGGSLLALFAFTVAAVSCKSKATEEGDETTPLRAGSSGSAGGAGTAGAATTFPADGPCGKTVALQVDAFASGDQEGWLKASATAPDKSTYTLQIELNVDPAYAHKPGDFDLRAAGETDYATCHHCVVAFEGADNARDAKKVYFQTAGTMSVETVTNPPTKSSKGSLKDVKLHEVSVESLDEAKVKSVPNGSCFTIASIAWDTVPAPASGACKSGDDCGDPGVSACDPATLTCVVKQCDTEGEIPCGDGKLCLMQGDRLGYGACYARCTPFDKATCPSDSECVPLAANQFDGRCLTRGTANEGEACSETDVSSGCSAGLRCISTGGGDPGVCRTQCDFWADTPSCPTGQQCLLGGGCSPNQGDPAAVGAPCAGSSDALTPCGSADGAYRGVCSPDESGGPAICRAACRQGSSVFISCDEGESCQVAEGEGAVPVCLPAPPEQP